MPAESRRVTVYFDAELHKALRLKAATEDRTVSDVINDAVRAQLAEDLEDLTALDQLPNQSTRPFGEFVADLKRRGKL
jgi:plasmid stability protein